MPKLAPALLVTVSLALAAAGSQAAAPAAPPAAGGKSSPPVVGTAAPAAPAAQLIDAAGLGKLLGERRGRIVVLNLWATWCVPCLREIPDLVAVEKEFASRGVTLVGLGMDDPGALAEQVEPFRSKNFPAFRTWVRREPDMDALVSVVDPAWNEILPTTYLIGRDGKVVKKIQGKRTLEQFRELVLEAL